MLSIVSSTALNLEGAVLPGKRVGNVRISKVYFRLKGFRSSGLVRPLVGSIEDRGQMRSTAKLIDSLVA